MNEQTTVIFQIYSKDGRRIVDFTPHASEVEAILGPKVVFPPNSHFLVCKKESAPSENAIYIYLREAKLGLKENVVIWLDDGVWSRVTP